MNRLLITHIADIDGITPVILTKLVFEHFDYLLLEAYEVNSVVQKMIEEQQFDNYSQVYITDLTLNRDVCEIINNNEILKNKIFVFDHHLLGLFVNDYDFGTVTNVDEDGNMQCGTSLYYAYLLSNFNNQTLSKDAICSFVELVRQNDTWEWFNKYNNINAKKLSNLFDLYGIDYFINYYYQVLLDNEEFSFTEKEEFLLEIEFEKIKRYISKKSLDIISTSLLNYQVGMVFAEEYRSELGNTLAMEYKNKYDFIVIINIGRSVSYRGIKDIDLSQIASIFGGKGHKNAAGSSLPDKIKEEVIKKIFGNKVVLLEQNNKIEITPEIVSI